MPEIPMEEKKEKQTVLEGDLEWKVNLDSEQLADFLISLGEQMKKGNKVTVSTKEWEIPFSFREPIELEIEYEGYGEKELEIELEFKGKLEDDAPQIS